MTKISSFQTNPILIGDFEFSPILELFGYPFVSDFDIRISGFSLGGVSVVKTVSGDPRWPALGD
jgi:hypothetical protein